MPGTGIPGIEPIRRRADFLAVARARRVAAPGMVVQARDRGAAGPARLGLTCSRKVGNAVARNRAKRRLRAAARAVLPGAARPGWDYVLIGRQAARPMAELSSDLARALARLHGMGG